MKSPIRRIKASDLVKDLEARLNDYQVMQKHGLTSEQLEYLFHKMMQAGLITRQLLEARASLAETHITKAFVEVQQSMDELDQIDDTTSSPVYDDAARALALDGTLRSQTQYYPTDSDGVYADALRAMAQDIAPRIPPPSSGLSGRRTIRATDLVKDVTSGMTDTMLMQKYQLEPKQLEYMLRKLVEAGRITETQLVERTSITSTSITKAFVDVYQSLRELDEGDWGH